MVLTFLKTSQTIARLTVFTRAFCHTLVENILKGSDYENFCIESPEIMIVPLSVVSSFYVCVFYDTVIDHSI